ncbi:uncharacterized protein LOC110829836 [Zootermopsis nevadensis]|uniref:uncharacterized protein LOC110829836 n=1 Tax=Zootermopsis nevadensis TaxID=136037 RepID=UPI000B8E7A71|nr:uncharacterized protein LOC110829836 [Zootermopsis nevadensis]
MKKDFFRCHDVSEAGSVSVFSLCCRIELRWERNLRPETRTVDQLVPLTGHASSVSVCLSRRMQYAINPIQLQTASRWMVGVAVLVITTLFRTHSGCVHSSSVNARNNSTLIGRLRVTGTLAWSPDGGPGIQCSKEEDNLEMSKRGSVEDEWIDRETGRKGL